MRNRILKTSFLRSICFKSSRSLPLGATGAAGAMGAMGQLTGAGAGGALDSLAGLALASKVATSVDTGEVMDGQKIW